MRLTSKTLGRPLGARILVVPVPDDKRMGAAQLIIEPETAETKATVGKVIAIGDGKADSAYTGEWPPVDIGDLVVYDRFAGTELRLEDVQERLWPRVLGIDEVLMVLDGKKKG